MSCFRQKYFLPPLLFCLVLFLLSSLSLPAQLTQYIATTDTFNISQNGQSFSAPFTNLDSGAYGTPLLIVYFSGDFGGSSETIEVEVEGSVFLGEAGKGTLDDCSVVADSNVFAIPVADLENWIADGSLDLRLTTSSSVDVFCNQNYLFARLQYFYCPSGAVQASISPLPTEICASDPLLSLSGIPTAGTFSGQGVDARTNTFDPAGLSGEVIIRYEGDDGAGCRSFDTDTIRVILVPEVVDETICPGESWEIIPSGFSNYQLFDSDSSTTPIATGATLKTPPVFETTTYYVQSADSAFSFIIDSISRFDSMVVDHDALSGDDRGGIAVTDSFVYVVGDNQTARYDLDLTNGVNLPIRDGIVSDLQTGQLWTLHNGISDPLNSPANFLVTELRKMDADLNILNDKLTLSSPIEMGAIFNNGNGIFSGYGFVILYSDKEAEWYVIDLGSGNVSALGTSLLPEFRMSENWAAWGVAEFDGTDYRVLFRGGIGESIWRKTLPDEPTTVVAGFSDLSDMASFTVSPWNDRWYFHYEGTGQFGGQTETLGYATALATDIALGIRNSSCRVPVTATINSVDIGSDSVICDGESVQLFAGVGFLSYSWNGDNSNFNVISADTTGTYVLEVVDPFGCTLKDTFTLIVEVCTYVSDVSEALVQMYPNPSYGQVHIRMEGYRGQEAPHIRLLNSMGQTVITQRIPLQESVRATLDLSGLSQGRYILVLNTERESRSFPLVLR